MVSMEFFIDCIPRVDLASNRNKKVTHLRAPTVSKSGSLNILVPGGPVMGLYKDYFTFNFNYLH